MPPKRTTPFGESIPKGRRPDDVEWVPFKGWHYVKGHKKAGKIHASSAKKLLKYERDGTPAGTPAQSDAESETEAEDDDDDDAVVEESQDVREPDVSSSFANNTHDDELVDGKSPLLTISETNDEEENPNNKTQVIERRSSLEPGDNDGSEPTWDAEAEAAQAAKELKETQLKKLAKLKEEELKLQAEVDAAAAASLAPRTTRQALDALKEEEQRKREQAVKDKHAKVRCFFCFAFSQ